MVGGVHIRVSDTVSGVLDAMSKRCADLRPALRRCGLAVQRSFLQQFAEGGCPRWAPLSLGTILSRRRGRNKRRRYLYYDPCPLIDTGTLRRSYTSRAGPSSIWREGPYWLTIGSHLDYAGLHQYGQKRTSDQPGVPARPLRILLQDIGACQYILRRWVERGLR